MVTETEYLDIQDLGRVRIMMKIMSKMYFTQNIKNAKTYRDSINSVLNDFEEELNNAIHIQE